MLVLSPTLRFKEINPDIDFEITVIVRKRIFCTIAKRDIGIKKKQLCICKINQMFICPLKRQLARKDEEKK